jgi:membrane protein YqaA with SNARE-associated domain
LSIWLSAVAAAAGGFLGGTGSYGLGRTAGAAAATAVSQPQGQRPAHLGREGLERHGATIIVVARFAPGGRTATTFTAGTVRLSWARFAAADAVGATLWAGYAAGLAYLGGETFERRPLSAFLFGLGEALLVALVVEEARRLRRRVPGLAVGARLEGGRSDEGQSWDGHKGILERDSNQTPWSKMPKSKPKVPNLAWVSQVSQTKASTNSAVVPPSRRRYRSRPGAALPLGCVGASG